LLPAQSIPTTDRYPRSVARRSRSRPRHYRSASFDTFRPFFFLRLQTSAKAARLTYRRLQRLLFCPKERTSPKVAIHAPGLRNIRSFSTPDLLSVEHLWRRPVRENAIHPSLQPVAGVIRPLIPRGQPEAIVPSTTPTHTRRQCATRPAALGIVPHEAKTHAAGCATPREPAVARGNIRGSEEHGDREQRAAIATPNHRRPWDAQRRDNVPSRLG
jgi:hypothetical protein